MKRRMKKIGRVLSLMLVIAMLISAITIPVSADATLTVSANVKEGQTITNVDSTFSVATASGKSLIYHPEPIRITFPKAIDPATVNSDNIKLTYKSSSSDETVPKDYNPTVDPEDPNSVIIDVGQLEATKVYTLTITGGVAAADGSAFSAEYSMSFDTAMIAKIPYKKNMAIKNIAIGKEAGFMQKDADEITQKPVWTDGDVSTTLSGDTCALPPYNKDNNYTYGVVNLGEPQKFSSVAIRSTHTAWHLFNATMYVSNTLPTVNEAGELTAEGMKQVEKIDQNGVKRVLVNAYPYFTTWTLKLSDELAQQEWQYIILQKTSDGPAYIGEVAVYSEKEIPLTISETDGTVTATAADAEMGKVILAAYDESGTLKSIKLGESNTAELTKVEGYSYRAYLWDMDTLMPVCEAVDL